MKKKLRKIYNSIVGMLLLLRFFIVEKNKISRSDVLFFLPYYHTGGAEKVHLNIIKAINSQWNVTVIFTHKSATENFKSSFYQNANCIEINNIRNKKSRLIDKWLLNLILKSIHKSSKVQTVFGCNTSYFYDLLPKIKNDIFKIDLFHAFSKNDERENILVKSASHIDKRIVISQKTKQDLLEMYAKNKVSASENNKIQVIENGITITSELPTFKSSENFIIGYVGRWSDEKRPLLFLKIATRFKQEGFPIQFEMVGTGMKSNIEKIQNSGAKFLGEITDEIALNHFYKKIHVLLITSEYEGFPMVMMESMSQGVVPISTNVGGISEHIRSSENGFLVENENESQIAANFYSIIKELFQERNKWQQVSENARKYALHNFDIAKFNTEYQEIFKARVQ